MRKEFKNHLLKSAILGCGIPTGIINGLITYFTGHEKTFMEAAIDMNITIAALSFIVAVLVYPIMLKLSHTLPDPGISRDEMPFFKSLPTNTFALSAVIMIIITIIFGVIPTGVFAIFKPASISVINYTIFKAVYTGIVAVPVNYIATAMAKFTALQVKA